MAHDQNAVTWLGQAIRLSVLIAVFAEPAVAAEPLDLDQSRVPLHIDRPDVTRIDALEFRGGLSLWTLDGPFGGLSGLAATEDGNVLWAVSDIGFLIRLSPRWSDDGVLTAVGDVSIAPLHDENGADLSTGKTAGDAEAMAVFPDGSLLVAFERQHRFMVYAEPDGATIGRLPPPPGIEEAPDNGGMEAVTVLADGRVMVLTESLATGPASVAGWLGADGSWERFDYRIHDDFLPTGADTLPDGDVIVLERRYNPFEGQFTRLRRIPAEAFGIDGPLDPPIIAELSAPISVDNFEGIAAIDNPTGGVTLFLISDDNFNPQQRTLLFRFDLPAE